MRMLAFFDSLKGAELVAYCGLLVTAMYFYMENVAPANVGVASSLASCVMAILTAGAIVKISRIFRVRMGKAPGRQP